MESPSDTTPIISLRHVSMSYAEFQALTDIDLDIRRGEIHAIVGEHGAGKSSLAQIMSGMLRAGQGTVRISGSTLPQYNLTNAQRAGIRMVYQQSYLNEHFSVGENLFYATKSSTRLGFYSRSRTEDHAREYLNRHGFTIDPKIELRSLGLSDRTVIELLKNLYFNPRVLILDETLEKLSHESYEKIIPVLLQMRDRGGSIVTITHRIDDIYRLANRVSVLKQGTLLATDRVDNINKLNLIRMAYTQIGAETSHVKLDTEFYQFLKYNEAILQYLPVNIIVVDNKLHIKMVNERCAESFDLAEKEYVNTPLDDLLAGNKQALELIRESVRERQGKNFYSVELRIRDKQSVNNVKTYPVFDGYNVIGTIIIVEDVTEYDRLQKQLIVSEKLASVGLLAAGVAHEINNPLGIISNYLSYVKYTHPEPEIHESIDKVSREIDYISKIVSNLVTFSDHGKRGGELVEVNRGIAEILDLLKYNAEYQHVTVSFSREDGELVFLGDENQFKQVILNLIKNSFEAMPEGGEMRIRTTRGEVDGNETTRIIVEDDGPGIASEDPNSIFLPFFSTKPRSKKQLGLGLGLSISYRIVESFGGEMSVENLSHRGCRFTIDLPRSESGETAAGNVV